MISDWLLAQGRDASSGKKIEMSMRERPVFPRPCDPVLQGDDPLWQFAMGWHVAQLRGDADRSGFFRD